MADCLALTKNNNVCANPARYSDGRCHLHTLTWKKISGNPRNSESPTAAAIVRQLVEALEGVANAPYKRRGEHETISMGSWRVRKIMAALSAARAWQAEQEAR